MKDPPRLLDELSGMPDELRLALDTLSATRPSAEQVAALASKLGVASPAAPMAAAGAKALPALKLALVVAAGAGLGGAGYALLRAEPPSVPASAAVAARPPPPRIAPGPSATPAAGDVRHEPRARTAAEEPPPIAGSETEAAPDVVEPRRSEAPATPEPGAVAAPLPRRAHSPASAPPAATQVAPEPSPAAARGATSTTSLSETELLGDARAALSQSPAVALSFCEQHRREFPKGALVQERELIAVTALVRLGRADAARARAERFRRNYPRSAYLRQLERVIAVLE